MIVNGRTQSAVDAAVAEIRSATGADVLGFAGDLGSAAAADAPRPDTRGPARFFKVNVLSGVRLARLYLPSMKQRNWGRIIFISSESAIQIPVEMIHYGTTKTAQLAGLAG